LQSEETWMELHVLRRHGWSISALAREFGLSRAEYEAVRDKDVRRLNEMGVHQYYIPQILRLFYGAAANANSHPALEAYKKAYPDELEQSERLQAELERRSR